MTTLVVYREDNLANPAKLLTHVEDIQAELARFALPFRQYSLAGIDLPKERAPSLEALRAGALDILLALQEEGAGATRSSISCPRCRPTRFRTRVRVSLSTAMTRAAPAAFCGAAAFFACVWKGWCLHWDVTRAIY